MAICASTSQDSKWQMGKPSTDFSLPRCTKCSRTEVFMKKTKILVIVDMQNDFLTGPLGNKECEAVVKKVCEVVKNGGYDGVIFTKDTHQADYMSTQEGKKLPVEHCIEGTDGWKVCDDILRAVDEKFTAKEQKEFCKNTFGSVTLGEYLRATYSEGKNLELDFVGVCTGICVINNVSIAKAFCPEAEVNVIENACACVTEQSHKTAIEAMKTFQVNII